VLTNKYYSSIDRKKQAHFIEAMTRVADDGLG